MGIPVLAAAAIAALVVYQASTDGVAGLLDMLRTWRPAAWPSLSDILQTGGVVAASLYCAGAVLIAASPWLVRRAGRRSSHARQLPDGDAWDHVRRGRQLERLGDACGAQEEFLAAVDSHCGGAAATAAIDLGDLLLRHGDLGSAEAAYRAALDLDWTPELSAAARRRTRRVARLTRIDGLLAYIANTERSPQPNPPPRWGRGPTSADTTQPWPAGSRDEWRRSNTPRSRRARA